jgi:hypothetical protein
MYSPKPFSKHSLFSYSSLSLSFKLYNSTHSTPCLQREEMPFGWKTVILCWSNFLGK